MLMISNIEGSICIRLCFTHMPKKAGKSYPPQTRSCNVILRKYMDTRTNRADYNSLRTALIDYDTLLDHVLKDKGIRGTNMGERLKSARSYFPHGLYNEIWEAHKMRNNLVHEATFTASVPALQRNREALKRAITQTSGVRKATRTA